MRKQLVLFDLPVSGGQKPVLLSDLLRNWSDARSQQGMKDSTLMWYVSDISQCVGYLERQGIRYVHQVNMPHLNAYLESLHIQNKAQNTRRRRIPALSNFFIYAYDVGYLANNPTVKLIPISKQNTQKEYLSRSQIARLRKTYHPDQPQHAGWIEVMLGTGITVEELIHLRLGNLTLSSGRLADDSFIRVPGRRSRQIPLASRCTDLLETWLQWRPASLYQWVFLNGSGEQLHRVTVHDKVKQYGKLANIKRVSPRILRHTYAVECARTRMSPDQLREFLGISDIQDVMDYYRITE